MKPLAIPAAVLALLGTAPKPTPMPVPELTREHHHASGAFAFRTPEDWKEHVLEPTQDLETAGNGLVVRFLYRPQEVGYDGLHAECMEQKFAGPMDVSPQVEFEYDFLSGDVGRHRILDSAFLTRYDAPILGYREWRQRNVTMVGAGESLCIIGYAPLPLWKKNKPMQALLDAVFRSVTFRSEAGTPVMPAAPKPR